MDSEDPKLEAFLRQFELRRPSPLPRAQSFRRPRVWMAAAAAALVLASAAVMHYASREDGSPPLEPSDLTAAELSQRIGWDVDALDEALSKASPLVLPDVERPESILKPLSGL